jgi:hypothetical protein
MKREANVALGLDAHFRMDDLMDVLLVALLKTSLIRHLLVSTEP